MKCPHCSQVHPDELNESPESGKQLKKACTNMDCSYYGEFLWPLDEKICPCCGKLLPSSPLKSKDSLHINKGNMPRYEEETRKTISQILLALQQGFPLILQALIRKNNELSSILLALQAKNPISDIKE